MSGRSAAVERHRAYLARRARTAALVAPGQLRERIETRREADRRLEQEAGRAEALREGATLAPPHWCEVWEEE